MMGITAITNQPKKRSVNLGTGRYDVFDIKTNKTIMRDSLALDISNKIGMSKNNVSHYAARKMTYKEQYKIERVN